MVRKTHQGCICAKFPNDYKTLYLENVTIVCDSMVWVNHKEQQCYFVNIEGIDSILHIVVKNVQVNRPPAAIFEEKHQVTDLLVEAVATRAEDEAEETQYSQQNVTTNVISRKEIIELCSQGIKVDDN